MKKYQPTAKDKAFAEDTAKDKAFAEDLAKEQNRVREWRAAWQVERDENEKLQQQISELKIALAEAYDLLDEMTGCTHDEILDYVAEKRRTNDNIQFVKNILNMAGGMY